MVSLLFCYTLLVFCNLLINPSCDPICCIYPKGLYVASMSKLVIVLSDLGYNLASARLGLYMTYRRINKIEKQIDKGVDSREELNALIAMIDRYQAMADRLQILINNLTKKS